MPVPFEPTKKRGDRKPPKVILEKRGHDFAYVRSQLPAKDVEQFMNRFRPNSIGPWKVVAEFDEEPGLFLLRVMEPRKR